jgi:hypothetical protein
MIWKKIAGFGDDPASFNYEATQQGYSITSFDPIYQFSKNDLEKRIDDVCITVMNQMQENMDSYVWTNIKSLDELENIRMSAMRLFLADYEQGKVQKRYIYHELPNRLPYEDNTFHIGLSSHFLLMYTILLWDMIFIFRLWQKCLEFAGKLEYFQIYFFIFRGISKLKAYL